MLENISFTSFLHQTMANLLLIAMPVIKADPNDPAIYRDRKTMSIVLSVVMPVVKKTSDLLIKNHYGETFVEKYLERRRRCPQEREILSKNKAMTAWEAVF